MRDDDSLAAKPRDIKAEATLADKGDPAMEPEAAEMLPEDFDLAAWIDGLQPTRRAYPVGGIRIVLQAHSMEWVREQMPGLEDLTELERTAELVARHVVEPAGMTRAMMLKIAETHPVEFGQLDILAAELDTKPGHMISPRFLRVASD